MAAVRGTSSAVRRMVLTLVAALVLGTTSLAGGPAWAAAAVPSSPTGVTAVAGVRQAVVSWTPPSRTGGSAVTRYVVTSAPDGRTASVGGGSTSTPVEGLRQGISYRFTVTATNLTGVSAPSTASPAVVATAPGRVLRLLAPTRLGSRTLAPGATTTLLVAGVGAVPSTGAVAALLTLHSARTTAAAGTVTVGGSADPGRVDLSSAAGTSTSEQVLASLDAGGAVRLANSAGSVNVTVDVDGWLPAADSVGTAGRVTTVKAAALLTSKKLSANRKVTVTVAGVAGLPDATQVAGVLVRLHVSAASASGSVVAWGAGTTPAADTLTFTAGTTPTIETYVPAKNGIVSLLARVGATLSLDVLGWVSTGAAPEGGSSTRFVSSATVLDTRTTGPALSTTVRHLVLAGLAGLPTTTSAMPATAVDLVVTPLSASQAARLLVDGAEVASLTAGAPLSTRVVVPLSSDGSVDLALSAGTSHATVVVLGYQVGGVTTSVRDHVLDASSAAAITSVTPTSVVFGSGAPAAVTAVGVGDVLIAPPSSAAPYGVLRRVEAVTDTSGVRTLQTSEATLADAVLSGNASTSDAVVGAAPTTGSSPDGRPASVGVGIDETYPFDRTYGGSTAQLQIAGNLHLQASMDLDVSVHASLLHPVDALLTVTAAESLDASATATADLAYTDDRLLGERRLPAEFFVIGGIPIWVFPEVTANLDLAATAHGEASGGLSQSRSYAVSAGYVGGNVVSSAPPPVSSLTFNGPSGAATAQVRLGVRFTYHYLVYGEAGATLSGEPHLDLTTDGCGADLGWGVTLGGGLEAKILGRSLTADVSFDALQETLASSGYHCTWDGTVTSTKSGSDTACGAPKCSYDDRAVVQISRTPQTLGGTDTSWYASDYPITWSLSVHEVASDPSTCWYTVTTTASGSGTTVAGTPPQMLAWDHFGDQKYYLDQNLPAITYTTTVDKGGPSPCPQEHSTSTRTSAIQLESFLAAPQGSVVLTGDAVDPWSGYSTHWDLTRHLPGT